MSHWTEEHEARARELAVKACVTYGRCTDPRCLQCAAIVAAIRAFAEPLLGELHKAKWREHDVCKELESLRAVIRSEAERDEADKVVRLSVDEFHRLRTLAGLYRGESEHVLAKVTADLASVRHACEERERTIGELLEELAALRAELRETPLLDEHHGNVIALAGLAQMLGLPEAASWDEIKATVRALRAVRDAAAEVEEAGASAKVFSGELSMTAGRCSCAGSTDAPCWWCEHNRDGVPRDRGGYAVYPTITADLIADAEERAYRRGFDDGQSDVATALTRMGVDRAAITAARREALEEAARMLEEKAYVIAETTNDDPRRPGGPGWGRGR